MTIEIRVRSNPMRTSRIPIETLVYNHDLISRLGSNADLGLPMRGGKLSLPFSASLLPKAESHRGVSTSVRARALFSLLRRRVYVEPSRCLWQNSLEERWCGILNPVPRSGAKVAVEAERSGRPIYQRFAMDGPH